MHKLRAYLQLVRLPAVFTAMADIVLGFLLNHVAIGEESRSFGLLLAASSCLYLSGMAFNDFFDRAVDANERPNRPIPSGRVSARAAATLGGVLMLAGVAISTLVARQSIVVALALTVCILLYDGLLKSTPVGPLAMGSCRFLNVMLGASAYDSRFTVWAPPQLYVAAALGIYVAGVTWFARNEATISRRGQLGGAAVVLNLGLLALGAFVLRDLVPALVPVMAKIAGPGTGTGTGRSALILLAVVMFTINRRIFVALRHPEPAPVQQAVKVMLLSLVTIDAAIIYFKTGEPFYAVVTVALLAPAMLLGKWIFMT